MSQRKRRLSVFLLAVIWFLMLMSLPLYTALCSRHLCCGSHCPICEHLALIESSSRLAVLLLFGLFCLLNLPFFISPRLSYCDRIASILSPVQAKIRMNN